MNSALSPEALNQLFLTARTPNGWTDAPVSDEVILQLYDLLKWGPTSSNSCPARFVWVRSHEGKERLASVAMPPNRAKILAAPVTVIVGYDLGFGDTLPKLLVQPERIAMLQGMLKAPGLTETMAMRNGSLQGAYLILAARALGLDCWPMSGFDNAFADREFFAGTQIKSNFICSLGYAKPEAVHPRGPRLTFDEAGRLG
jgi:3-hydroxypropanoate dehydrogenase